METCFAPAGRTDRRKLRNQISDISSSPIMNSLLTTMGGLFVVLNEERQLVAINHAFLAAIGIDNAEEVLGLRLGESLHCIHAQQPPHGCGTTPFCVTCGAAIAMMTAIKEDKIEERICALTSAHHGETRDCSLLVRAQPLTVDGNRWILVFAQDITQQQLWANLERVFFHDISNMLSSLHGFAQLLVLDMPKNEHAARVHAAAERLCQEIALQRGLCQQKNAMQLMQQRETSVAEIREGVAVVVHGHAAAQHKRIIEVWPEGEVAIKTDPLLVSRVLGNMMINALEASAAGETVRLTTQVTPTEILWEVWSACPIPEEVQKRVFQKHFSTKGVLGRGLGTYSMKLFGEQYLHGKIDFVSSPEEGTTFSFHLPFAYGHDHRQRTAGPVCH